MKVDRKRLKSRERKTKKKRIAIYSRERAESVPPKIKDNFIKKPSNLLCFHNEKGEIFVSNVLFALRLFWRYYLPICKCKINV